MKKLTFLIILLGLIFITTSSTLAVSERAVQIFATKDFVASSGNITFELAPGEDVKEIYSLPDFNDVTSSVIVGKNVKVILYSDADFKGNQLVLYPGEYKDFRMNFGDNPWNDKVSSLKVVKLSDPNVPLIKLTYYDGFTQMIGLDGTDEFKSDWCLLRDNDVKSADIPAEYKVTFYEDFNYEGFSNVTPIKGGKAVNMKDYSLERKVSSIKIEWQKYKLTKVLMEKTKTKPKDLDAYTMPMAANVECRNPSSSTLTCTKHLESTYTATATTNWQNSTTVGITATTTVSATAEVAGVGSSSVEASLALSVANEFAFGKTEEKSHGQTVSDDISVQVPPGGAVGFDLQVQPVEIEYDVTYTYSPEDGQGADKIIKGTMTVKSATSTNAVTRNLDAGNTQSPPAPAEQSYAAAAWEWIKSSPQRLWEFFNGTSNSNSNSATNSNSNSNPTPNSTPVNPTPNSTPVKSTAEKLIGRWKGPDGGISNYTGNKIEFFQAGKTTLFGTHTYRVVNDKTLDLVNEYGNSYKAIVTFQNDDTFTFSYLLDDGSTSGASVYTRVK